MEEDDLQSQFESSFGADIATPINPVLYEKYSALTAPKHYSGLTTVAGAATLGLVDVADTFVSSLPGLSKLTGINRGDITQGTVEALDSTLRSVDLDGLTSFYQQQKGAVQLASMLEGVVASDVLAKGVLRGAMRFAPAIRTMPGAKQILALDSKYKAAIAEVNAADLVIAARTGGVGATAFTESVNGVSRAVLASRARWAGIKATTAQVAGSELAAATLMNQHEMLFSDDMGENLAFFGIGLVGGAGLSTVFTNYAFRKFANSDAMKRVLAGTFDPSGLEKSRIFPTLTKSNIVQAGASASWLDEASSYLLDAATPVAPGVDKSIANRVMLEKQAMAFQSMNKASVRGAPGVVNSGFSMSAQFYGNNLKDLVLNDPSALIHTEYLAAAGEGRLTQDVFGAFYGVAQKQIDEANTVLQTATPGSKEFLAAQQLKKDAEFNMSLQPLIAANGQLYTKEAAEIFDAWEEPLIHSKVDQSVGSFWAVDKAGKSTGLEIGTDGSIFIGSLGAKKIPTGVELAHLPTNKIGQLYRLGDSMLTHLRKVDAPLILADKPNWFQLDLAERMLQLGGKVQFPTGLTRETALLESFIQKAQILRRIKDPTKLNTSAMRFILNLPVLNAYETARLAFGQNPVDILLKNLNLSTSDLRSKGISGLLNALENVRKLTDPSGKPAEIKDILGNSFDFLTEKTTQGPGRTPTRTKPVVIFKRPVSPDVWNPAQDAAEGVAISKLTKYATLAGPQTAEVTREIFKALSFTEDFKTALNVAGLSDIQMQSTLPLLGNAEPTGAIRGITDTLTSQPVLTRDISQIQAATRLRTMADQLSQKQTEQIFSDAFGDTLNQIASPRNLSSRTLAQHYLSHAPGWELGNYKAVVKNINGVDKTFYTRELADTAVNRERWELQFPNQAFSNVLVDNTGKTIYLDDMSKNLMDGFEMLADHKLDMDNSLRRVLGLSEAKRKAGYIPAPDVENKFIGYGIDTQGRIVPGTAVIADTKEQFNRILQTMKADANNPLNRAGVRFTPLEDIKAYASLLDRMQMEMTNPGWMPVVGRYSGSGKNAAPFTNLNAIEDVLATYRSHFLRHGRDVIDAITAEAQAAARIRIAASGAEKTKGGMSIGGRSVYEHWLDALTGRSPLSQERSWWGVAQKQIEGRYNAVVGAIKNTNLDTITPGLSPAAQRGIAKLGEYLKSVNPITISTDARAKKEWEIMRDELDSANPFLDVVNYLEARNLAKVPGDLRKHLGTLQSFTTTALLRLLEAPMMIMNYAGVVNTMPAVIRHLQRLPGESIEEQAARLGFTASIFTNANGQSVAMLDSAKMALNGFRRAWGRASAPENIRLSRKGMLTQSASEFNQIFNNTEMRGGLDIFLNGDPRHANPFMKRGIVGWLSYLTDESEHYTRSWATFTGLEYGEKVLKITDIDQLDNFAHDFANKVIANYSPLSRPEILQGPLGSSIGLFTSYIRNYYERIFRYIETKDGGALATQLAMQAGLFGASTIPGYNELQNHLIGEGNDKLPYDVIYDKFGRGAADLLMYGTLGNIPKLFGGDGIDFTSRGGTEVRLPVLMQAPAIVSVAEKIGGGVVDALGSIKNGTMSEDRALEILANSSPNRFLAGLINTVGLDGNDIDSNGRIAMQSTNLFESTANVLGTRSIRQAAELRAFYTNKTLMEVQAAQMDKLKDDTRAAIRGGATPEELQDVFDRYVQNGGNPYTYKRWLKSQYENALNTRSELQLRKMLKNPALAEKAQRLANAYVSLGEEEDQVVQQPSAEDYDYDQ